MKRLVIPGALVLSFAGCTSPATEELLQREPPSGAALKHWIGRYQGTAAG